MEGNGNDTAVGGGGRNERVIRLNIPWEKVPKMPFWGYLGGYSKKWQQKAVGPRVATAYIAAGRPLTDTEIERMSYWWGRSAAIQGHQVPIYLASTLYFQSRARPTWRFPFYQPKDFNPYVFPSKNRPTIKGDGARMIWRFIQTAAYYTVSRTFTAMFFASWAMSATSANIARDEQLQQWVHDAMENQKKKLASPGSRNVETTPGDGTRVQVETGSGETNMAQDWRTQDQDQDRAQDRAQDQAQDQAQTSPTAQRQATWPNQPAAPRPQAFPQYQPPAAVVEDPFGDDDASPIAPAARRQQAPAAAPGSAWAKVRQGQVQRQEGSTQAGSWAKARQNGSQGANQQSYSYSEAEEGKEDAQQQAQKDFDQMLEKERQGKEEKSSRRW